MLDGTVSDQSVTRARMDAETRNGRHKGGAPFGDIRQLCLDFIGDIPRQDQNVVKVSLCQHGWGQDGDMATRKIFTLFGRCGIKLG